MNDPPQFFFDECIGHPVMDRIVHRARQQGFSFNADHLSRRFRQGFIDDVWIPQLKGWILISSDQARKKSRGRRLPDLCVENKITHVLIGVTLHHKTSREKERAILDVWNDLMKLSSVTPGSRYRLNLTKDGPATLKQLSTEKRP